MELPSKQSLPGSISSKSYLSGHIKSKSCLSGNIKTKSCLTGHISLGVVDDDPQVIILVDEAGNEIPAFLTDEEVQLTATANDIRAGSVAVTNNGITTGDKIIPSYNTTEASVIVLPENDFSIELHHRDLYDYTKLMAVICPFNLSLSNSVSVDKTAINDHVYPVLSAEPLSIVSKDSSKKTINFGIRNDSDKMYVIRYFTYKEIY